MGDDKLVPKKVSSVALLKVVRKAPLAETSGYPLPARLYTPPLAPMLVASALAM